MTAWAGSGGVVAEPQAPARKGNVLTRKIGPLPTWAWVLIGAAIVIGYAVIAGRSKKQEPSPARAGAGQVPQFVNQTFVSPEPPEPPEPKPRHRRHHRRDRDHDDDDVTRTHYRPGPYPNQPPTTYYYGGPGGFPAR